MARFKSFVGFFFSYYNASLMSDEDYVILYELFSSRNPDFACLTNRFDLDEMNDDECKVEFGVRKCHTEKSFLCCRIKFNLRFDGFRPNWIGCTSLRLAQWSFQPDQSKQLSLSYLQN